MNVSEALDKACAEVGIIAPKTYTEGRWTKADTRSGKNGKGDGRVMVGGWYVVSMNWQTGQHATVKLKDGELTAVEREQIRKDMERVKAEKAASARHAARVASALVAAARLGQHPYLIAKGLPGATLTIHVDALVPILEANRKRVDSLVAGRSAIVVPARRGQDITTVQLIWEDGTKKMLAGGEIGGAVHRLSAGRDATWLCEGFATGLTLSLALKGLNRRDTVLCAFSASNVATVAEHIAGRCYIAGESDKPLPEYGGIGTSEYWARRAGKPYVMPAQLGMDFDDLRQADGIFAVQRVLGQFLREAKM